MKTNIFALIFPFVLGFSQVNASCIMKTDYDPSLSCGSGTVTVKNQQELDDYLVDYGQGSGSTAKKLRINFDITNNDLQVHTPCELIIAANVTLSGDNICLDGREGVTNGNGYILNGGDVTILSELDKVGFGSGTNITADNLTMQGAKEVKIGQNAVVNITNAVSMTSTGNAASADVKTLSGVSIMAASLSMLGLREVFLGLNTVISVSSSVSMTSTGEFADSDVRTASSTTITAASLEMLGKRAVFLGANATANISGSILMTTTGDFADADVRIRPNANIQADKLLMTATREVFIGNNSTVDIEDALEMRSTGSTSAVNIRIGNDSQVSTGSLLMQGERGVYLANSADVIVTGLATMTSTGTFSTSNAELRQNATMTAAEFRLQSGNKAQLDSATVVNVTGNFLMQAPDCTINTSSTINAGSTSGSCLGSSNQAPVASFTFAPTQVNAGVNVSFTSTSTDSDGNIVSWEWDFGDGQVGSGENVNHSYTSFGDKTVTLTVTDDDLASATTQVVISVNALPQASFTLDQSFPNPNESVNFVSTSTDADGSIVSWNWDFGDGQIGSGANVSHAYTASGPKTVTLTVTDDKAATAVTTVNLVVNSPPVADFFPDALQVEVFQDVTFTSSSTDADADIVQLDWLFGDGASDRTNGSTIIHQYSRPGTKTVRLTATDSRGLVSFIEKTVIVTGKNKAPFARFLIDRNPVPNLQAVTFSSISHDSDGSIIDVSWDFGDGQTDDTNTDIVTHTYSSPGNYLVTLTVEDDAGAKTSYQEEIVVNAGNLLPQATLIITPETTVVGASVSMSSEASDEDGSIVSYSWDFGDGQTDNVSGAFVFHSYAAAGTYTVQLTVTDDLGGTFVISKDVIVLDPNVPPVASFTVSNTNPSIGEIVTVTSTSVDSDGTIVSYKWDFGNSIVLEEAAAVSDTAYSSPGLKEITLTVVDDQGESASAVVEVVVEADNELPIADIEAGKTVATVGETVDFISLSSDLDGNIVSYAWDFADGTTVTTVTEQESHVFTTSGTYSVSLTVTDDAGAVATDQVEVAILDVPILQATAANIMILRQPVIEISSGSLAGSTTVLSAAAIDASGQLITVPNIEWVVTGGAVSVNPFSSAAIVTGVQAGTATVQAKIGTLFSAPITVNVLDPGPGELVVLQDGSFTNSATTSMRAVFNLATNSIYNFSTGFNIGHRRMYQVGVGLTSFFQFAAKPGEHAVSFRAAKFFGGTAFLTKTIRSFEGRGGFLNFDQFGDQAVIDLSQNPLFDFNSSFSMSFWVKHRRGAQNTQVFSGDGVLDWSISLGNSVGVSKFAMDNGSVTNAAVGYLGSFNPSWQHITIVFDKLNDTVFFYEDGELRSSIDLPTLGSSSGSDKITLGGNFIGVMDELRFWNTALSASEVSQELFTPASVSDARALAFFSFDDVDGQRILDDSVSGSEVILGTTLAIESKDPRIGYASEIVKEQVVASGSAAKIEISADDLASKGVAASFSIDIPEELNFPQVFNFQIEVVDPKNPGLILSAVGLPLSPIFRVYPASIKATSSVEPFKLSIPFDADQVTEAQLSDLRVYRTDFGQLEFSPSLDVYTPNKINLEKGQLTVEFKELGSFWVGLKPINAPEVEYTDPLMSKSPFERLGDRTFLSTLSLAGAGPHDVPISTSINNTFMAYFACSNGFSTYGPFPSVIPGLPKGDSVCSHYYDKFISGKRIRRRDVIRFTIQ